MAITQSVPAKFYGSIIPFPLWVDDMFLGVATVESYTVPADASFCIVTCTTPVWACISGTAAVPTTEIADGSGSFYISAGTQMKFDSGDVVSFISAAASIVSIGVYRI
jgi:hypothetical protein